MSRYTEQLQRIVDQYIDAGQRCPASAREIAAWAISQGLWKANPSAVINQCADQLARAMREDYIKDPQGHTVRAKHAARTERGGEQLMLWADIRTAPRKHMQIAFQQRRQQIVGDCRQLKTDVDSFNDNRSKDKPIPMIFNFTYDLMELEAVEAAD